MGDVGSLSIGSAIGTVAVITKQEILLVLVGGLFVVEALSVIFQVGFFKVTHGRRIFKMAPLHHHFELKGWPEPKVIVRFWIIAIILALISMSTLKVKMRRPVVEMSLANKKVLVVGLGRTGLATVRFLEKRAARITVTDLADECQLAPYLAQTREMDIRMELGHHHDETFAQSDLIVVSPGVPHTLDPIIRRPRQRVFVFWAKSNWHPGLSTNRSSR